MQGVIEIAVSIGRITAYLDWYEYYGQKLPTERYFRIRSVAMAIDGRFHRLKEDHRELLQKHWDRLKQQVEFHRPDSL